MDPVRAREQFLSEPLEERRSRIASNFSRISSEIHERRPAEAVTDLLKETEAFCDWAAPEERAAELKALLPQLKTALETWRTVWPRMEQREEFRLAVAREAALWAKRLTALAEGSASR